jgi:hypothetical protein
MAKAIKKPTSFIQRHHGLHTVVTSALAASVLVLAWAQYRATPHSYTTDVRQTTSKLAHVDGIDATDQVANFYKQYIDTRNIQRIPGYQSRLIEAYGSQNLVFYSRYYQHGFDAITCSTVMPTKVTASLVSTGPMAIVNAVAAFPDGSTAIIKATVVLTDKLAIDSITCPGEKGNLPPPTSSR